MVWGLSTVITTTTKNGLQADFPDAYLLEVVKIKIKWLHDFEMSHGGFPFDSCIDGKKEVKAKKQYIRSTPLQNG